MSWMMKGGTPIVIYTDGACINNPGGAGGWAAIIVRGTEHEELSGYESVTTNNRMEMMAALKALESLPQHSYVTLITDSQYLQKGISLWLPAWKKRAWVTKGGSDVKNEDLWKLLDTQNKRHTVVWQWVKGHNGDLLNERCDKLAVKAAKACNQLHDKTVKTPRPRIHKPTLQEQCRTWIVATFGEPAVFDQAKRNHRFLEEALELVQTCGLPREQAHMLVDYVYDRPSGEKVQELGGVMLTLLSLANAHSLNATIAAELELKRCLEKIAIMRGKEKAKPPVSETSPLTNVGG